MYVERLALTNFRSYAEVDLAFAPGVTSIVGSNGRGKTNIIEAIGYLGTLSSHRVAQDAPLVRNGCERAYIRGAVNSGGRTTTLEVEINPGRANRARINGSPVPRPREIVGILKSVLFAPEDLALVKGDPGDRRYFLDQLLMLRTPRLAGTFSDFERTLKQRNALLRSAGGVRRFDAATLDVWDASLATLGSEIVAARHQLLNALTPLVQNAYSDLAAKGEISCTYKASNIEYPDFSRDAIQGAMRQELISLRNQELDRGVTLLGPQRDDVVLTLNENPAKGYASHGESWSYALALRLASYDLLRGDGEEPILILDDVFAELDAARRAHLTTIVADAEQVIITAAVGEDIPSIMSDNRIVMNELLGENS